jgi:hypothetical protein
MLKLTRWSPACLSDLGLVSEQGSVRGQRQVLDSRDSGDRGDQSVDTLAQQRFPAGDADLLDPEGRRHLHDPGDLLVGKQLGARLPLAMDRHRGRRLRIAQGVEARAIEVGGLLGLRQAVEAPEIAAVGDADPEVPHHPTV